MSAETVDAGAKDTNGLNDYVELRFQERLAKLSEELSAKVDKKIQERLDSDRTFVTTMVGNGVKLLGYAVALVTIVIGVAGVKSCSDINHAISGAAQEAVQRKLESDNPNSDFNRLTNRLLNRALLDSYLTSIARIRSQTLDENAIRLQMRRKFPKFNDSSDAKRLTQLLFDSSTDTETDFKDALQILDYTGSLGSNINPELTELALAQDNKYSWIRGVPDKRIELLKKIKNPRILPVLQTLIANETDSNVKIAAIQAASEIGNGGTMKALEELAVKENAGPLKDTAVIALARYKPDHPLVSGWLDVVKKAKTDALRQSKALLLALEVMKGPPKNREKDAEGSDDKVRLALATDLIKGVIANGFRLVMHPTESGLALIPARKPADRNAKADKGTELDDAFAAFEAPSVPAELLFGAGADAVASLLGSLAAANDTRQLTQAVDALSLHSDNSSAAVVKVTFGGDSPNSIKLKDNTVLNTEAAPTGVQLKTVSQDKSAEPVLWAFWNNADGVPRKGIVVAFEHPELMTFELAEVKSPTSAEE
ncbi:MAG: hypothetical protein QOE33_1691 [Acidobacteriota bacterium]|nr:hypothetical protein [Acidobacteriota bacterium]